MRQIAIILFVLALPIFASAKIVTDTVDIGQKGFVILTYDIVTNGDNVSVRVDKKPRISPSDRLRKECKGDLSNLKVVVFDRVGDFGKVKWKGLTPTAFMVPSGLSYDKSEDGYYILGETTLPMSFTKKTSSDKVDVSFPLYVALWEKKQTYKILDQSIKPLKISIGKSQTTPSRTNHVGVETEQIAIQSSEELEADNEEAIRALSSIRMVRQLLSTTTELPFSQALQMEIYNLHSLKDRVKDTEILDKIDEVLLLCDDKERELKEAQRAAEVAEQTQAQALIAQQKLEEEARQQEAEEKARLQEEKQQKRTLWMIIGGVILAILAFIGNAVFRHFRDIRNQKSIMEMQESIAKQAEHEATRRTREIVRNKAHQMTNKGKSKMREAINNSGKTKKDNKNSKNNNIKSI